jgi:hypothetical protein
MIDNKAQRSNRGRTYPIFAEEFKRPTPDWHTCIDLIG